MPISLLSTNNRSTGLDSIELIQQYIDDSGKRVVEFRLPAATSAPWHYHSTVVEYCFCLSGELFLETGTATAIKLGSGEHGEIPAGLRHRVVNRTHQDCRLLVVQTGEHYDFVASESRS